MQPTIKRFNIGILFGFLIFTNINAQSIHINGNRASYHLYDRINVLNGLSQGVHSSIQTIDTKSLMLFYKNNYDQIASEIDKENIKKFVVNHQELLEERSDTIHQKYMDSTSVFFTYEEKKESSIFYRHHTKPILKYLYKSSGKFFEINKKHFKMSINPILDFKVGKEKDNISPVFKNLRGVVFSGLIDDKVYFYTDIMENQQLFNNFTEMWIDNYKAVPGGGLYKNYQSSVIDRLHGWDFLNSQAYVGVKISKSINVEFGHGRHFIGNGIRSLLLSDFSNNYFYLKFNTKIWKFQYQNIFAELSALSRKTLSNDQLIPKKYFAAHYFSYKFGNNIELGLFETIVFSRENHFEFQYLNPIILYRTVEHALGSPDNVIVGLNGSMNLWRRLSLYGQLVLDEFHFGNMVKRNGWWANKYGLQFGLKYFNAFNIDQLDAQIEYNMVRPYTYSHSKTLEEYSQSIASYSNYNQPLAHPRGANFKELLLVLKYSPIRRLSINAQYMHTIYGEDDNDSNWGTNILNLSTDRQMDFGNEIGQGFKTSVNMLSLNLSYEVIQNYYFDLNYVYRNQDSELISKTLLTNYLGGGIRINIGQLNYNY